MPFDYTNRSWIRECRDSLKNTSWDQENREYMLASELNVISFDEMKEAYLKNLGMNEDMANSADAMTFDDDYTYLIEFKNGEDIDNVQIENKVKDSVTILCDEWNRTVSNTREDVIFVLVYNESRKKIHGLEKIAINRANQSGRPHTYYGLYKANVYVKKAVVLSRDEFQKKLLPRLKNA